MADHEVKARADMLVEMPSSMEPGERLLLAAALAATLVDYRYEVRQNKEYCSRDQARVNWRTIGRWEQLRG